MGAGDQRRGGPAQLCDALWTLSTGLQDRSATMLLALSDVTTLQATARRPHLSGAWPSCDTSHSSRTGQDAAAPPRPAVCSARHRRAAGLPRPPALPCAAASCPPLRAGAWLRALHACRSALAGVRSLAAVTELLALSGRAELLLASHAASAGSWSHPLRSKLPSGALQRRQCLQTADTMQRPALSLIHAHLTAGCSPAGDEADQGQRLCPARVRHRLLLQAVQARCAPARRAPGCAAGPAPTALPSSAAPPPCLRACETEGTGVALMRVAQPLSAVVPACKVLPWQARHTPAVCGQAAAECRCVQRCQGWGLPRVLVARWARASTCGLQDVAVLFSQRLCACAGRQAMVRNLTEEAYLSAQPAVRACHTQSRGGSRPACLIQSKARRGPRMRRTASRQLSASVCRYRSSCIQQLVSDVISRSMHQCQAG